MKISASNSHAQAMQAAATKNTMLPTQGGGQGQLSIQASSMTRATGAVDPGTPNLSPSERLANYAAHMEERLDMLESNGAESGLDLSEVRSDFRDHITRLQDAMSNGMMGDDLTRGIENTSNLVRDGVREAVELTAMVNPEGAQGSTGVNTNDGGVSTNIDVDHSNERLDAIEKRIQERLNGLFENGKEADKELIGNAREQFEGHMNRLRDALASGNMSQSDMQRSMENIMQHLQDNLAGATTYTAGSSDSGTAAGSASADEAGAKAVGQSTTSLEAEITSRKQALTLLSQDMQASANGSFKLDLASMLKPGSPAGNFLQDMRDATHKAKGGVNEGYTPAALKASIVSPDMPGSKLNFNV